MHSSHQGFALRFRRQPQVQGTLKDNVSQLEMLVRASTSAPPPPPPPAPTHASVRCLPKWKKSVEGQWISVWEDWALERERLASAREEWVSKVDSVASNLGSALARIDAGLALLASMQSQQRMANGDVIGRMGFLGNRKKGSGELVTPPSPGSLSADSSQG